MKKRPASSCSSLPASRAHGRLSAIGFKLSEFGMWWATAQIVIPIALAALFVPVVLIDMVFLQDRITDWTSANFPVRDAQSFGIFLGIYLIPYALVWFGAKLGRA